VSHAGASAHLSEDLKCDLLMDSQWSRTSDWRVTPPCKQIMHGKVTLLDLSLLDTSDLHHAPQCKQYQTDIHMQFLSISATKVSHPHHSRICLHGPLPTLNIPSSCCGFRTSVPALAATALSHACCAMLLPCAP
jgi:hypothetical protein